MSTREPLWYCHECHAEMRPLMAPDPVCASCHGSFVEKMENPADDPRFFTQDNNIDSGFSALPPGVDNFFMGFQTLMDRGIRNPTQTDRSTQNSSSMTFEVRDRNGSRTIRVGGAHPLEQDTNEGQGFRNRSTNSVPNMSTFVHQNMPPGHAGPMIPGPLLAQYLMTMFGNHNHDHVMFGMPENGRMGDYIFNQEALDQIITQLMENSNASRPVPVTEAAMDELPREVLMESSPTLQKDCAVCKEQFKLGTEDPDEQVVVTLPCKHPFHEPCILPWLRSSGTCPVCRYALVPQPGHHPTPPSQPNPTRRDSEGTGNVRRSSGPGSPGSSGLFHSFFGGLHGFDNRYPGSTSSNNGSRIPNNDTGPASQRLRSNQRRRSHGPPRRNSDRDHFPGGWSEQLD